MTTDESAKREPPERVWLSPKDRIRMMSGGDIYPACVQQNTDKGATVEYVRADVLETSNKALREAEAKLEHLLRAAGDGVEVGRQRMIVTDAGEFRNLSASTDTLQVRTEDVPIYEWRLRVLGMTLRESLDALAPALVDGKEKS